MLKVHVKLNVAEALRQGFVTTTDGAGYIAIEIPDSLNATDLGVIADHLHQDYSRDIYTIRATNEFGGKEPLEVNEPTVGGIIGALKLAQDAKAAREQKRELERQKKIAELAAGIRERRETKSTVHFTARYKASSFIDRDSAAWTRREMYVNTDFIDGLDTADRAAFEAWRAEIAAANKEAESAAEQQYQQNVAKREAREAAVVADRVAWIATHGSTRLRKMVAAGIEHGALYKDEKLAIERPRWRWEMQAENTDVPRNPPEAALDLLAALQADDAAAKLVYVTGYRKANDDEYEIADSDGDVKEYYYAVQAQFLGHLILSKETFAPED